MGCDIHAIYQVKKDGRWIDVPCSWNQNRQYTLFAWLADVRNEFDITPISKPRGFPKDLPLDFNDEYSMDVSNVYPKLQKWFEGKFWFGDHSFSWLTFGEIRAAPKPTIKVTGVVTVEDYKTWDKVSEPDDYRSGVYGYGVKVDSEDQITEETTHVRVSWYEVCDFSEFFESFKDYPDDGRMIFGFDS